MGKKDDKIRLLEEQNVELLYDIEFLEERITTLVSRAADTGVAMRNTTAPKTKYAGSLCFDFWPPKDWFRLGITHWNPGRYFQLRIGPIRLDFFAD